MSHLTVYYFDDENKLQEVGVDALHPDEAVWIGARKVKMETDVFRRRIVEVLDKRKGIKVQLTYGQN